MTIKKISLMSAIAEMDAWSPAIAGQPNGQDVRVAKLEGAFDWHSHADADEAFLVLKGAFRLCLRDGDLELGEGDFAVVPAGVEHRPVAEQEAWVMMITKADTRNTGGEVTARTKTVLPHL